MSLRRTSNNPSSTPATFDPKRVATAAVAAVGALAAVAFPVARQRLATAARANTRRATSAALARASNHVRALVPYGMRFPVARADESRGISPGTAVHSVVPRGTRVTQWQSRYGGKGSWFSPTPATPWEAGISPVSAEHVFEMAPSAGLTPMTLAGGQGVVHMPSVSVVLRRKINTSYEAQAPVRALASEAAPIVDFWSMAALRHKPGTVLHDFRGRKTVVPELSSPPTAAQELDMVAAGSAVHTPGGAQQLLTRSRGLFK